MRVAKSISIDSDLIQEVEKYMEKYDVETFSKLVQEALNNYIKGGKE